MTAINGVYSRLKLLQQNKKIRGLVFALVFLIFVLSIFPLVISSQIKSFFKQNHAAHAEIENIDFNPFTLQFALQGLSVKQQANNVLKIDRLSLALSWQALFREQVLIENLQLEGLSLYAEQVGKTSYKIAGIDLPLSSAEAGQQQSPAPLGIAVVNASLKNVELRVKREQTETQLAFSQVDMSALDSHKPEQPAQLNLQGTINQSAIKLHGNLLVFADQPEFTGKLLLEPLKLDEYFAELDQGLKGNQATVSADAELQLKVLADNNLKLYQKGKLKLEAFSWQLPESEIKLSEINWQGDVSLQSGLNQPISISMQGGLGVSQLKLKLPSQQLLVDSGLLNWNGNVSGTIQANSMKLNADGQLTNWALAIDQSENLTIAHDAFSWQGVIKANAVDNAVSVALHGKLQDENLKLLDAEKDLEVNLGKLIWQGDARLNQSSEMRETGPQTKLEINKEADLKFSNLVAQQISQQKQLASVESLQLDALKLKDSLVLTIKQVLSAQLLIGATGSADKEKTQHSGLVHMDSLELKDVHHSPAAGIMIGSVNNQGVKARLERDKQGSWNFQKFINQLPLSTSDENAKSHQEKASAVNKPLSLAIKRITVGNDSKIVFIDQTQEPEFNQQLNIQRLLLEGVDTSSLQRSPVEFKGGLGKARMDVAGSVQMFAQQPTVSLKGQVKNLSLLPFSNLSEKSIGYSLDSGKLTADFQLEIDQGKLDSEAQVVLHQLDIKPLSEQRLKQLAVEINSGIETGLSMLKDKNDTIKFKLPVKGPLDKVQFDPGDIINQALGTALKSGAKTYLAAALFPFGTLLVIADVATDGISVKLDPVKFVPGDKTMDEKMHEYLGKVAKILEEKPRIHVKVCGVSAVDDKKHFVDTQQANFLKQQSGKQRARKDQSEFKIDERQLARQLDELAKQRANVVYDYLVNQLSVDSGRLVECQPRVDTSNDKIKPGAELLL